MNEFTSIEKFQPESLLSQQTITNILVELTGLTGIKALNVAEDSVSIEYYQEYLSSDLVKDALVKAGFPFKHKKHNYSILQKFIEKMGEDNYKEFGGNPPKCCGK